MRIKYIASISISILGLIGSCSAFSFKFDIANILAFSSDTTETQCFDKKDNDNDGFKDCLDIDCFWKWYCSPIETNCNDNKDNDGDGHIDCADNNCDWSSQCTQKRWTQQEVHYSPITKEICNNMIDDTSNWLIDCADPVCLVSSLCNQNIISEMFCEDWIDNNNNWLIDCEETSCRESQSQNHCEKKIETSCNDDIDNDGDWKIDCVDTNCKMDKHCDIDTKANTTETCHDDIDNDWDWDVDCEDVDCDNEIDKEWVCQFWFELNCSDGFDNDGDSNIDCEDNQCQQQEVCNMSCWNNIVEWTETCDDGNTEKWDWCFNCQNEEPTCELIITHYNGNIEIQKPHERFNTQKLIINNHLVANVFSNKKVPINKIWKHTIYRQAFNGEKLKQCQQTITVNTIKGCTDELASNFNTFATYNDWSCQYGWLRSINCSILNATARTQTDQTTYSRNNTVINTTKTKWTYLVSKDGRISASFWWETTIIGESSISYPFLQIIEKNGAILSCPIKQL